MTHGKLLINPLRPGVRPGVDNTVDVLVRVQAPPAPEGKSPARPPLHLSLVLDRSGSMNGRPIQEAKRCASFVVNRLRSGDKAAIVAYDSHVETLAPLSGVGSKPLLLEAIQSIRSRGTTALHDGWLAGADSLASETSPALLSRVLLLSDGCANQGVTNPEAIWRHCAQLAEAGVTTSTYGLGRNFNEDLMTGMSRAGRGQAYYGETADDLFDPIMEELSLLEGLFARQVELGFSCPDGIKAEVINDYPMRERNRCQLPDIGYDSEAWVSIRLSIPAALTSARASIEGIWVTGEYVGRDGERHLLQPATLTLPILANVDYARLAEDPAVASRLSELNAADLQDRARKAARRGDWKLVDEILLEADRVAGDHPWLLAMLRERRSSVGRRDKESFAKEAAYSANKLRGRLCSPDERKETSGKPVPDYVRRKAAQGKADLPNSPD
jgi:Ca-activated chloride channel homolog